MFRYLTLVLPVIVVISSCSTSADNEYFSYTPCENGFSGNFPCKNIGLYAHLPPSELLGSKLNDIWGWIDPETDKEYALVGLTDGVAFVDVTNPSEPVLIGKLLEPDLPQSKSNQINPVHHEDDGFKSSSNWRDLKVYENTLYVVSEQQHYGLQIFELAQLRNITEPPVAFQGFLRYRLFGNAHNIEINHETQFIYITGATSGEVCAEHGGLHIIDISSPFHPEFAGCYYDENAGGITKIDGNPVNGYIHDTQCVIYRGPDENYFGREICFNSSESVFLISDVEDKANPFTISIGTFEGSSYIHQGWLTEDHRYFFMNDEGDERQFNHHTRTYVWDVMDLENPEMIGFYEHDTEAVDHNLYIKNDFMYQANYTAGLRILDVSNSLPENVTEVGFFNTTPDDNTPKIAGLWSVYPWLTGDKIIVSDINNGLFILKFKR